MADRIQLQVPEHATGGRLDVFLASALPGVSRTRIRDAIQCGEVMVGGRRAKPSYRVAAGDEIEGALESRLSLHAAPQHIPLRILYADADLAIVDKPAGLVVHPAPGHPDATLANALVARFPRAAGVGAAERPGIVHRLDKDTSGLMVVALTEPAQQALQRQLAQRQARREYLALVWGRPRPAAGTIDIPVGRDPRNRRRMAPHGIAARAARTAYRTIEEFGAQTLVEARLETGRTHQIRVHFAAIGFPLVGDATYGGAPLHGLRRQFLHAARLTVQSPSGGHEMTFESPLPSDLSTLLIGLRAQGGI